jgi:polygalacturonase
MGLLLAALPLLLAAGGPSLSILDFGGKPDGETNNQPAIVKAMHACAAAGGCTLLFPRGNASDQPQGPAPYHPWGVPPLAVYRTGAINLTSHLRLVLEDGVQLRGTEDFVANCGGSNRSTCDDFDSPWPVLPNPVYPSRQNSAGDDAGPVKQAFIRGYNLTDISIGGGGEIHGGGGWWWCVRMAASTMDPAKHEITGAHAPRWCEAMVRAGLIPDLAKVQAPHMLHLIGCKNVLIENITISNSPEWTIHLQYSDNVTLSHVNVFNTNNET